MYLASGCSPVASHRGEGGGCSGGLMGVRQQWGGGGGAGGGAKAGWVWEQKCGRLLPLRTALHTISISLQKVSRWALPFYPVFE